MVVILGIKASLYFTIWVCFKICANAKENIRALLQLGIVVKLVKVKLRKKIQKLLPKIWNWLKRIWNLWILQLLTNGL